MGERRELFAAGEVVVVSSPCVEDLGDDTAANAAVLGGSENGEQELVGRDACSAVGLWGWVATGSQFRHRSDQVHSGEVGVLRFDQPRVDVDEDRAVVAEDQVGRERSVPVEIPAQDLEPATGVGHRHTRLVAGASARALGGALVGVECDKRSVVEHRLAHD